MYLENSPKGFLFPPGSGGIYTGNGYILVGMVLAAVTGAPSFDALDQRAALGVPAYNLSGITFMVSQSLPPHPPTYFVPRPRLSRFRHVYSRLLMIEG